MTNADIFGMRCELRRRTGMQNSYKPQRQQERRRRARVQGSIQKRYPLPRNLLKEGKEGERKGGEAARGGQQYGGCEAKRERPTVCECRAAVASRKDMTRGVFNSTGHASDTRNSNCTLDTTPAWQVSTRQGKQENVAAVRTLVPSAPSASEGSDAGFECSCRWS